MLGRPQRFRSGPSGPNIVKGGTHGEREGERARGKFVDLAEREAAPSNIVQGGTPGERVGERARRREKSVQDRNRAGEVDDEEENDEGHAARAGERPSSIQDPATVGREGSLLLAPLLHLESRILCLGGWAASCLRGSVRQEICVYLRDLWVLVTRRGWDTWNTFRLRVALRKGVTA